MFFNAICHTFNSTCSVTYTTVRYEDLDCLLQPGVIPKTNLILLAESVDIAWIRCEPSRCL